MNTRLATRRRTNRLQTAFHSPAFAVIAGLLMLLAASVIACAPAAYSANPL
jgi:hypothetical protein